jgi:hypothetical protein
LIGNPFKKNEAGRGPLSDHWLSCFAIGHQLNETWIFHVVFPRGWINPYFGGIFCANAIIRKYKILKRVVITQRIL